MARCPDCNKFVSLEAQEPEADLQVDYAEDVIVISGDVRCVMACTDCGTELREASFRVEVDQDHSCPLPEPELSWDVSLETSERTEGRGRGMRTWRGYEGSVTINCACGFEAELELSGEERASAWDDLS